MERWRGGSDHARLVPRPEAGSTPSQGPPWPILPDPEEVDVYPTELTEPMRAELTSIGVSDLTSAEAVDAFVEEPGSCLLFVNSVCGCAAGGARPGLSLALQEAPQKPDRVGSVFAGVDKQAADQARSHFAGYPPSSPSAALLKDGEVVWMLHRHQIEGRPPEAIAQSFAEAFAEHCG